MLNKKPHFHGNSQWILLTSGIKWHRKSKTWLVICEFLKMLSIERNLKSPSEGTFPFYHYFYLSKEEVVRSAESCHTEKLKDFMLQEVFCSVTSLGEFCWWNFFVICLRKHFQLEGDRTEKCDVSALSAMFFSQKKTPSFTENSCQINQQLDSFEQQMTLDIPSNI